MDSALETLKEYIRIPNQSPHFDNEWESNGYLDDARPYKRLEASLGDASADQSTHQGMGHADGQTELGAEVCPEHSGYERCQKEGGIDNTGIDNPFTDGFGHMDAE